MAITSDKHEFRTYLDSIVQKYQHWSNLYTLTDVVDKQQVNMLLMEELILRKQNERGQQNKGKRLPVLEGICKYAADHVLLVGKPGSGKSTALQRLLWEKAITADVIPVLVELRSWQPETGSAIKLIQKVFRQNRLRLNEDEIEDLLFDGKLLDLLAQLQRTNPTVTEAQKQAAIVKTVEQHIKQYPTLRDRLWNAFKSGGIEALKQALDAIYKNPFVSISVETVKGFLEAEYRE